MSDPKVEELRDAVVESIMARRLGATGTAVFVDRVILADLLKPLLSRLDAAEQWQQRWEKLKAYLEREYRYADMESQGAYRDALDKVSALEREGEPT